MVCENKRLIGDRYYIVTAVQRTTVTETVTVVRLTAVTIQYSIILYGFLFLISEEAD